MRFMSDDLWASYKDWLLRQIGVTEQGYSKLFTQLHSRLFSYSIEMDENRASDGVSLREDFYDEMDISNGVYDHRDDCSVLEMLVALSLRIEKEYTGDPLDQRPGDVFWEMLQNLGLDQFEDWFYNGEIVNDILDRWLNRRFAPNGDGSPFPICRPRQNQRKIEIWAQVMEYLSEKG